MPPISSVSLFSATLCPGANFSFFAPFTKIILYRHD
jgi:hypothetical protein